MAITRFQDLPSTNTPINSANLNGNFDELGVKVGTSIDNNYRTNIIKGKNLFNINDITPNNFLDSNTGDISSSTSWSTSNYIEVSSSTSYVLNYVRSGTSNTTICFYNSSKAFISSVSTSTLGLPATFTTPSNAKYLRFDYKSADNQTNIQLEKGSTATTYEPFIVKNIVVDNEKFTETVGVGTSINSANRVNFIKGKNLFNGNLFSNRSALGVTTTFNNSEITFNGTTSGAGNFYTDTYGFYLEAGTYTFKFSRKSGTYTANGGASAIIIKKTDGTQIRAFEIGNVVSNPYYSYTFTLDSKTQIGIQIFTNASNQTFSNLILEVQFEKGSSATYEPYVTPSINVDGEEIYSKDNLEQYSTSETRIGTWIDGKPLYRKVFIFNNPTSASILGNSGITPANVTKIDALGTQATANVGGRLPIGYNGFCVQINSNGAFYYTNPNYTFSNLTIIVEYTK